MPLRSLICSKCGSYFTYKVKSVAFSVPLSTSFSAILWKVFNDNRENQRMSTRSKSQQTTTRATVSLLTLTVVCMLLLPNSMVFDLQFAISEYLQKLIPLVATPIAMHWSGRNFFGSNLKLHLLLFSHFLENSSMNLSWSSSEN